MTAADVAVARSTSVRRPTKPNTTAHSNAPSGTPDPYYGHEKMAKSAALFITSLFSCPELPPPSTATTADGRPVPSPKLPHFIAYALHRTRLAEDVTYAALFLLQRLKTRFPAARGSSGHRLFISAFMIASKVICDDTYSNKSWCVVGQGMFSLREINQMEREMCGYLEWVLNIQHPELEEFKELVKGMPMDGSLVVLPDFSKSRPVVTIPVSAPPPPYSPPSPQDMREDSPDSDFPDSPSHSDTTSPMSSAPQTPPSQDDVDDSSTRIISSTSPVKPMPHVAHVVEDKVARRVSSVGAFGATRW